MKVWHTSMLAYVGLDAWLCWLHKLQVYTSVASRNLIPKQVMGRHTHIYHLIITTTTFDLEYKASKIELLVQGKKLYHKIKWTVVTHNLGSQYLNTG